jgi:hypothetical protein
VHNNSTTSAGTGSRDKLIVLPRSITANADRTGFESDEIVLSLDVGNLVPQSHTVRDPSERHRILDMLSAGTLAVDDAVRLLGACDVSRERSPTVHLVGARARVVLPDGSIVFPNAEPAPNGSAGLGDPQWPPMSPHIGPFPFSTPADTLATLELSLVVPCPAKRRAGSYNRWIGGRAFVARCGPIRVDVELIDVHGSVVGRASCGFANRAMSMAASEAGTGKIG